MISIRLAFSFAFLFFISCAAPATDNQFLEKFKVIIDSEIISPQDKQLAQQVRKYYHAFYNEDAETIIKVINPDLFLIMRDQYSINSLDDFAEYLIASMNDMMHMIKHNNIKMEVFISPVTSRVDLGSQQLSLIPVSMTLEVNQQQLVIENEIVGVSLDGGKEWTILEKNDQTPQILQIRFPEQAIQQLFFGTQ